MLAGGVANPGAVVRVGNTVRRPRKRQTESVHTFLQHLVANGLDGVVPTPLGFDERDREILSFLDGEIALPPSRAWIAGDELLVSVADLQRRLHDVARSYVIPPNAVWDADVTPGYLPDRAHGALVCHNDLCVENVVIRDSRAAGVIDFDYAGPVNPLFDIAVAVRHWAPARAPEDLADLVTAVDPVARFRLFLDVHELDAEQRAEVTVLLDDFLERAFLNVQRLAGQGEAGFAAMIADGYLEQNRRSLAWIRASRTRLAAA